MKMVSILSVIILVVLAFSFASKPKPTTFEQDMQGFKSLVDSKALELSGATTNEDSVHIANDVKAEADYLSGKWDIQAEFQNRAGTIPCWLMCISNFFTCIDRGHSSLLTCLLGLINCERGCALP